MSYQNKNIQNRGMAGRLTDARSTLDDLLKQLAEKQEALRYFYIEHFFIILVYHQIQIQ